MSLAIFATITTAITASNNYGCEGPSRKRFIREIRKLKWKDAMLLLFLAQGVPMIMAGDEICNSQDGNNNAYCQDNPTGL